MLWTTVKGMFSAGADAIVAILSGIITVFKTLGGAIMDGLIAGIKAGWAMLTGTIRDIASLLPESVKKILGIHSPSRVFAQIGGHVMTGLDQGLAANTSGPLSRITDLSGQMTRALAVGAGGVAIAVASQAAAQTRSANAAAQQSAPNIYQITINVTGAAQSPDIEAAVRRAIEQAEREKQARGFHDGGN